MTNKLCPHCGQPMVIPKEENKAAELRCKQLNSLEPFCALDKHDFQLTWQERLARERYNSIMAKQTEFENKYC